MRRYLCMFCVFSIYVLALENESSAGGAAADQCVPVVTDQDLQSLNQIASNPTDYLLLGAQLSKQDVRAMQRLVEEAQACGRKLLLDIPQIDSLLYVMDLKASLGGPISPTDVLALRNVMLDGVKLTIPEKQSLSSCQSYSLSEFDRSTLHKYIDLAKQRNGLAGFPIFMRLQLFQIILQNLGSGFSLEDIEILRKNMLNMMGLSDREIATLHHFSYLPHESKVTDEEAALLEKWIRIENAFPIYALMDFEEFSSLHSFIQDQTSPPFSAQSIRNDQKAFQKSLEETGVIVISPRDMQMLQGMIQARRDYIQGTSQLSQEQIRSGNEFLLALLQLGKVPGFDELEIGQLLELMQRSPAFRGQEENIHRVLLIESIKNGFSQEQKQNMQALIANPQAPLSQKQVSLLKMYIMKAKQGGGLNGFTPQEKAILLSIIQNNTTYFTPSDVTVLRKHEMQNMNLPEEASSSPEVLSQTEAQKIQEASGQTMSQQMQQALQQQQATPQMPSNPPPTPRGPGR